MAAAVATLSGRGWFRTVIVIMIAFQCSRHGHPIHSPYLGTVRLHAVKCAMC